MVLAAETLPAAPVVIFMAFGVILATFGHASKNRTLVITGLVILFMATLGMLIGGYLAFEGGEGDPRELDDPKEPNL